MWKNKFEFVVVLLPLYHHNFLVDVKHCKNHYKYFLIKKERKKRNHCKRSAGIPTNFQGFRLSPSIGLDFS